MMLVTKKILKIVLNLNKSVETHLLVVLYIYSTNVDFVIYWYWGELNVFQEF